MQSGPVFLDSSYSNNGGNKLDRRQQRDWKVNGVTEVKLELINGYDTTEILCAFTGPVARWWSLVVYDVRADTGTTQTDRQTNTHTYIRGIDSAPISHRMCTHARRDVICTVVARKSDASIQSTSTSTRRGPGCRLNDKCAVCERSLSWWSPVWWVIGDQWPRDQWC